MIFEQSGPHNTQKTIDLVLDAIKKYSIEHIVVASVTGETARKLAHTNCKIVCVSHVNGFRENGKNEMPSETRQQLESMDIPVLTTTHVLSGVERGLSKTFQGIYPAEIMSHSLRMFGEGTKVCVEVAVMALDAGRIPYGQPILAIGGTAQGADTAVLLTPAHASRILETKIHTFICKPW